MQFELFHIIALTVNRRVTILIHHLYSPFYSFYPPSETDGFITIYRNLNIKHPLKMQNIEKMLGGKLYHT